MHAIFKSLLNFILLTSLSGMASAAPPGPPTDLVGSWKCRDTYSNPSFLVTFNLGGTFTASASTTTISVNHGVWQRTGLNTFTSTDYAYQFTTGGEAEYIIKTDGTTTMLDNENLTGDFDITVLDLDGTTVIDTIADFATCTRI